MAHRKDDLARRPQPPAFDREKDRGRSGIGPWNGGLEERRRRATRYEKLGVNFRATVQLAFVRWYPTR